MLAVLVREIEASGEESCSSRLGFEDDGSASNEISRTAVASLCEIGEHVGFDSGQELDCGDQLMIVALHRETSTVSPAMQWRPIALCSPSSDFRLMLVKAAK